jgi:outer membrane protein assembly factor BamA
MKQARSYLTAALAAAFVLPLTLPEQSLNASPLVSIGDNTDVFFSGSSSLRWTSNVFRDEDDEVSDLLWVLSPGFEVNVGRGLSNADLSVITRYDIVRYQDEDQLDTELFHIKAIGSYKTSRLDLNGSVSFDETKTSTGDVNVDRDLIEYDTTSAELNAEYRFSPKFSFGAGVRYTEIEYQSYEDIFADRDTTSVPLDLFYELTPKVDLSVGYTYTSADVGEAVRNGFSFDESLLQTVSTTQASSGYDQTSHFFNIGARGNLLPKLSGFFKIGYRVRDADDSSLSTTSSTQQLINIGTVADPIYVPIGLPVVTGPVPSSTDRDDTSMLGFDADLTWAASPKLTASLGLSRDFGFGGEGQTTENTGANVSASYSINSNFAATGNLGYTLRDYSDDNRKDHQYEGGIRLSYLPNQYWRFSTGYTYSENDSDSVARSYTNHIWDIAASLRY